MTAPEPEERTVGPLLWSALAALAGGIVAPLEPNVLEEGIVVHTAERMLLGDHLYRDVISHTAPLPYELLAALFRLFGPHIGVARGAVVVVQALGGAAAFAIARRAGAGNLAHVAGAVVAATPILLIPLFSTYFYTTLAFYLGLVAVYAGLRAADARGWALVAGALLAAIALCKQSTGVVLAAAFLPAAILTLPRGIRLERTAWLLGGGASIALLTFGLYALRGDLAAFVWSQVELALVMGSSASFGTPFINLWPPGELDPLVRESWVMYLPSLYHMKYGLFTVIGKPIVVVTQLLYALPFLVLGASALRALRSGLSPAAWLHGAFLVAMVANLYPRADWGHLVVALPTSLVQLVLLFRGAPAALAALLVGALATSSAGVGVWLYSVAGEPSFGPRVPLRPVSRSTRSPAFPRVIHYLLRHAEPGEPIFVPRQEPLVYFATGTTNPTPFEGVLQGVRELQETRILEALDEVRFVVMSDIDQPLYTYYSDELPGVWAYFERHFEIPRDFPVDDASWITVASRGSDRGEAVIDLIDARAGARAWTRADSGAQSQTDRVPQRLAARHLRRPLPVELGARGGGIDWVIDVPEGAVLRTAVGYRGLVSVDHQYIHPRGTTAVVAVRAEGDDAYEELAAIPIDDRPRGGRRWTPVAVDLAPWAGRRVTLRLAFRTQRPLGRDRLAWFGSPRITRGGAAD